MAAHGLIFCQGGAMPFRMLIMRPPGLIYQGTLLAFLINIGPQRAWTSNLNELSPYLICCLACTRAIGFVSSPKFHVHALPSDYKSCLRLQELPQTTRVASDYKSCLRLQELPQIIRVASDYKSKTPKYKPNTSTYKTSGDYKGWGRP